MKTQISDSAANVLHELTLLLVRPLRRILLYMRLSFFISLCPLLNLTAATVLPVSPLTFESNSDYDSSFKESQSFNGAFRSPNGYLEVLGVPNATAAFDTSANGGVNGSGGSSGSDANNDLSNFTVSADAASSVAGGIGVGFLLRMNSSESNGYLAAMFTQGTTAVTFNVFEGAGLNTAGTPIFGSTIPLTGLTIAANTFYPFKVTIAGGVFSFDFGSGAAVASFTDTSVSAITGQVGFSLSTLSPTSATRLDNFTIVPEPSSSDLILISLAGCTLFQIYRGLTPMKGAKLSLV